jgi:hypothetical protein
MDKKKEYDIDAASYVLTKTFRYLDEEQRYNALSFSIVQCAILLAKERGGAVEEYIEEVMGKTQIHLNLIITELMKTEQEENSDG